MAENGPDYLEFQSSFELTGYITSDKRVMCRIVNKFQSSFELTGYITPRNSFSFLRWYSVSKLFRAYRLYNESTAEIISDLLGFKALSSLQVI